MTGSVTFKNLMQGSNIQVVARVRPCFDTTADYADFQPNELDDKGIRIEVRPGVQLGWITKPKPHYEFSFNKLFWKNSKQDQIFDKVALPLIHHCIDGYNATLFAYGQTGSGKTYTLSGGETYDERGIIPRTITYLFQQIKQAHNYRYEVRVSYIEIYNNIAYDLLSTDSESRDRSIDKLAKVQLNENPAGGIEMMHEAAGHVSALRLCENDEEAFSFLFLGETNRAIAATQSNDVSSRSHCIFSLHIDARNVENGTLKRSKLHLVDLAGSERVDNLGDDGQRVQEARYINQSLFYLHNVIDALKSNSDFVPYRSSKMTMLLKDSLGGNCLTTMIATVSSKFEHIHESIQTMQFAVGVMTIKNNAKANVSMDPQVMIEKLRAEIVRLKHELAVARGEEDEEEITPEESQRLIASVKAFMSGKEPMPSTSPSRTAFCFDWLRANGVTGDPAASLPIDTSKLTNKQPQGEESQRPQIIIPDAESKKVINTLTKKVKSREMEISVLVNMLNQKKNRASSWTQTNLAVGSESEAIETPPIDKKEAFNQFRNNHPKYPAIQANNETLGRKIEEAKRIHAEAHSLKEKINKNKAKLQEKTEEDGNDVEITALANQISKDTEKYMKMSNDMKAIKKEVDTIKAMIDQAAMQVKRDFTTFWMGQQQPSLAKPSPAILQHRETAVTSTEIAKPRSSSALGDKKTGDPIADEKIRQFKEATAQFRKKADDVRHSVQKGSE